MDHATALRVRDIMLDASTKVNQSIQIVMDNCDESEFRSYRLAAGQLMGSIYLDILTPLFADHPDLTPSELRDAGKDYSARD
jgi:hypothetical protein